jgi:hypothetical protein
MDVGDVDDIEMFWNLNPWTFISAILCSSFPSMM